MGDVSSVGGAGYNQPAQQTSSQPTPGQSAPVQTQVQGGGDTASNSGQGTSPTAQYAAVGHAGGSGNVGSSGNNGGGAQPQSSTDPFDAIAGYQAQDAQQEHGAMAKGFVPNPADDQDFGFRGAQLKSQVSGLQATTKDPAQLNKSVQSLLDDFHGWVGQRQDARQQQIQSETAPQDSFTPQAQTTLNQMQARVAANPNDQVAQAQVAIGQDRKDEVQAEQTKGFKANPDNEKAYGANMQPLLTDLYNPTSTSHDQDLSQIKQLVANHAAQRQGT